MNTMEKKYIFKKVGFTVFVYNKVGEGFEGDALVKLLVSVEMFRSRFPNEWHDYMWVDKNNLITPKEFYGY